MSEQITQHTLDALLAAIEVAEVRRPAQLEPFSALTADSRAVEAGSIFVAVRGTRVDGHSYIRGAVCAGATAIVCEEFPAETDEKVAWIRVADASIALGELASWWHGYPSRRLKLVGVTGTNGKTTIATLLFELAGMLGIRAGLLSTVENRIGEERIAATHTTPDPLELNALLAKMVAAGCTFAAMEVSSHSAAQHRIAGLDFDGGVFTNLTRDHLDYHGTVANYLKAKQSFFDGLKPEAFALTNLDDRNGPIMLQNTRAKRFAYSLRSDADFRGKVVEDRLGGMLLSLNGVEVETMFVGRFNAANLTAVYGAACLLGVDPATARQAISAMTPVAGRFQPFRSADGVVAIVDYAHTPDALVNVLDTIRETAPHGQVITVCGCGGDRDRGKRPIMAAEAAARSNRVILTSDNPRSEDPNSIIAEMRAGLSAEQAARTLAIVDRAEAIRTAVALAAPGDVILVAGKGHEDYQIIGAEKRHFDDREQVAQALALRTTK